MQSANAANVEDTISLTLGTAPATGVLTRWYARSQLYNFDMSAPLASSANGLWLQTMLVSQIRTVQILKRGINDYRVKSSSGQNRFFLP